MAIGHASAELPGIAVFARAPQAGAAKTRLIPALGAAAAARLQRVLTVDPGMGVVRHVDAGYPEAIAFARANGVKIPMENQGD